MAVSKGCVGVLSVGVATTAIISIIVAASTGSDTFCVTSWAMDMHMYGFKSIWSSDIGCVILFASSWPLDTRVEFVCACSGVYFLAAFSEYLGYARRELRKSYLGEDMHEGVKLACTFLFVSHVGAGYLLMLVAMTYQVELLVFVLLGLGAGYHFFGAVDAPVGERVDPCCADIDSLPVESAALLRQGKV